MRPLVSLALCFVLIAGCAAFQQREDAYNWTPTPKPTATLTATDSPSADPTPLFTLPPVVTFTPAPTPVTTPGVTPVAGRLNIDLYRKGAFVSEVEKYMCLPAAMQVMINIMKEGPTDRSAETQWRLYEAARTYLIPGTYVNGETGAQPEGWASVLNDEGYGPYQVVVRPTLEEAIHLAAKQLRLTNRPVGLLVWRGAHSWSMSGFRSSADPLLTDDFTVEGIYAEDVWYPRISSIWGESFPPDTFDPFDAISIDFRRYRRPHETHPDKDGQYVMIMPLAAGQPPL